MNILLTFTGFHDPYTKGLVGEDEQTGPILSLVSAKNFDQIILFSTPNTEKNTIDTKSALSSLHQNLKIEVRYFPIEDPTNYFAILKALRPNLQEICNSFQL